MLFDDYANASYLNYIPIGKMFHTVDSVLIQSMTHIV